MRFPLLLLTTFLWYVSLYAQEPIFRHFTTEDGLPSNELHDVIQDRNGYIWIASELGVSRYDGYKFENFGISDGMPDQVIFDLQEDSKGRIWFHSFSGKLACFDNGRILKYRYNSLILKYAKGNYGVPNFYMSGNDSLHVSINHLMDFLITPDGRVIEQFLFKKYNVDDNNQSNIVPLGSNFFMELVALRKEIFNNSIHCYFGQGHTTNIFRGPRGGKLVYDFDEQGNLFMIFGMYLLKFPKYQKHQVYANLSSYRISAMILDRYGRIILGNVNDGIRVYSGNEFNNLESRWLRGKFITDILEDSEGGFWITTHHSGLYYLPNERIKYYPEPETSGSGKISALCKWNNKLFIGYEKGGIYEISFENGIHWKDMLSKKDFKIYDIALYDNLLWVIGMKNGFGMDTAGNIRRVFPGPGKCSFVTDSALLISGQKTIQVNSEGWKWIDTNFFRITKVAINRNDEIIGGNQWGLWKWIDTSDEKYWKQDTTIQTEVSGLVNWDSFMIVATRGSGIILKNGETSFSITQNSGLLSNNIQTIQLFKNQLWLASDRGINIVNLNPESPMDFTINSLRKNIDLPSFNVFSMKVTDSLVWLGTENGLYSIKAGQETGEISAPVLNIEQILVNGNPYNQFDKLLKYSQNNLSFSFTGIHFKSRGNIEYLFRLKGYESKWIYSAQRQINYNNLPPGEFQFQVQTKTVNGPWSAETQSASIVIAAPFWMEIWFLILISLAGSGIIIFIIYEILKFLNRKELKKNQNKLKILEMEIKTLRAQMNPHFTFNTLNSIQHYIWQNDPRTATEYLAKFASLIRKLLENSRTNRIILSDELDIIEMYLELENLRLNQRFSFTIKLGQGVYPENIEIPAALIQPYVENAIWHGISKKKENGLVEINFILKDQNVLQCIIKDNGVGREKTRKSTTLNKKDSLGTKITEERISLLKEVENRDYSVHITDLYIESGEPAGTQVTIDIPLELRARKTSPVAF